jgi:Fic family protein
VDISSDIFSAMKEHELRVETRRSGPFTFRMGLDLDVLALPYQRVLDAHERLKASPLAQVANRLEREVVVSSIFGTNSIEGGTLSEEETAAALNLDPNAVQAEEQRRALNIKAAYDLAREAAATPGWQLELNFIRRIHAAVTDGVDHPYNQPGRWRDNPKEIATHVGDIAHGGRYKPPQHGADILALMEGLVAWHAQLVERGVPALIRAPLVHYHYELIHPFWDGNGRVGRVLEAALLLAEGYRYAPFALARYYLEQIDRYFTLFNTCRKAAAAKQAAPNSPFVALYLEGMLGCINRLHDRVNALVVVILFESDLHRLRDAKAINARQFAIVSQVLENHKPLTLAELRRAPWYTAMYEKRTDKTKQRDLRRLREQGLIKIDAHQRLWPGFIDDAMLNKPIEES